MRDDLYIRFIDRIAGIDYRYMDWISRNGSEKHKVLVFDPLERDDARWQDEYAFLCFNLFSREA